MISLSCDFCKKPIRDVAYHIDAVAAETLKSIGFSWQLHYDCIVPWRERDK